MLGPGRGRCDGDFMPRRFACPGDMIDSLRSAAASHPNSYVPQSACQIIDISGRAKLIIHHLERFALLDAFDNGRNEAGPSAQ